MRILWLKSELLHPVDKGGRIRTYQMLKALTRSHLVTYLTLDDGTAAPDAAARAHEYCSELVVVPFQPAPKGTLRFYADLARNLYSPLPYVIDRYRAPSFADQVNALAPRHDLVICDFLTPSPGVSDAIARRAVLFQHNVEAMIWERHAAVPQNVLRRTYMRLQWRRMRRFEARACARFGKVVAVSDVDARYFRTHYGTTTASAVPTGVDTDYFAPAAPHPTDSRDLVFVGSMDWMPNDDGIRWFAQAVFPLVRQRQPDATLTVVGRSPSADMQRLAERTPGIRVTGSVPDVRPYLQRAVASVVPLRIGGGTRLKVFEAMAAGAPVVSTAIGAEGLPVQHGRHLLIADSPEAQAEAIVHLLTDRASALAMADRAREYVCTHCSWNAVARQFLDACTHTEPSR